MLSIYVSSATLITRYTTTLLITCYYFCHLTCDLRLGGKLKWYSQDHIVHI